MRQLPPRLQRFVRALLACWALLVVFEPPAAASAPWQQRALSAWRAPGVAGAALDGSAYGAVRGRTPQSGAGAQRVGSGARASQPSAGQSAQRAAGKTSAAVRSAPEGVLASAALLQSGARELWPPRLDGRYLYLEYQSLLC